MILEASGRVKRPEPTPYARICRVILPLWMSTLLIQILLIDDHELIRSGVEALLNEDPDMEVVAVGSCGEEAISLNHKLKPDIILMDVNMPGMDGIEATKRILRDNPHSKVIALSVHEDGLIPSQIIKSGAKGYLNKGCHVEEMTKAILSVHRGGQYISTDVANNMLFNDTQNHANVFDKLSDRELQITRRLIKGQSIQEIADHLSISTKTVNTHRYRMHDKLKVKSDVEMMRLAARHGLIDGLE